MKPNAIQGRPASDYDYEFMVIIPTCGGNYQWVGDYEDADPAYKKASEVNGVVAHNVRIAHKQKKS